MGIATELVDAGVMTAADIVDGVVTLRPNEGRNRNITVELPAGRGRFVKQPTSPGGSDLDNEAGALRFLTSCDHAARVHIPRLIDVTASGGLVLELIDGASNLVDLHAWHPALPAAVAAELGGALGAIHAMQVDAAAIKPLEWNLCSMALPDRSEYLGLSGANLTCLEIIQRSGTFEAGLRRLDDEWETTALVHGDIRLANILVRGFLADVPQLWLVDWEFCGRGDPGWDLGCLFAEYVALWVCSMPYLPGASAAELSRRAERPLETIQPFLRAFVAGYVRQTSMPTELLQKAVRFAAAGLIRIARSLGEGSDTVLGHQLLLLQVAEHILRRPDAAASQLLGLGLPI